MNAEKNSAEINSKYYQLYQKYQHLNAECKKFDGDISKKKKDLEQTKDECVKKFKGMTLKQDACKKMFPWLCNDATAGSGLEQRLTEGVSVFKKGGDAEITRIVNLYKETLPTEVDPDGKSFGPLTDGRTYENRRQEIVYKYERKRKNSENEQQRRLQSKIEHEKGLLGELDSDPQRVTARLVADNLGDVAKKRQDLLTYLETPGKIKKSPKLDDMRHRLFEPVAQPCCGESLKALSEMIDSTIDVSELSTKNIKDPEKASAHAEESFVPNLMGVIAAVVLLCCFILVFSIGSFVPSATSIAAGGAGAVSFVGRIVKTVLTGVIGGGLIFIVLSIVLSMFDISLTPYLCVIPIAIVGFITWNGNTPSMDLNDFMGFGNIVHGAFVWIPQLLLCVIAFVIVRYLFIATPLSMLFYSPPDDVGSGIDFLAEEFKKNSDAYKCLVQYSEATQYAYRNEIARRIKNLRTKQNHVSESEESIQIEKEMKGELEKLSKSRDAQIKERDQIIRNRVRNQEELQKRNKDKIREFRENLKRAVEELHKYIKDLAEFSSLSEKGVILQKKNEDSRRQLLEYTDLLFDEDEQRKAVVRMREQRALSAAGGEFPKEIFLLGTQKDSEGLAVLTRIPIYCDTTVCVYNKNELANETRPTHELAPAIRMFLEAFTRMIPYELCGNPYNIIDTVDNAWDFQSRRAIYRVFNENDLRDFEDRINGQVAQVQNGIQENRKELNELMRKMNELRFQNKNHEGEIIEKINSISGVNKILIEKKKRLSVDLLRYLVAVFIVPPSSQGNQKRVITDSLQKNLAFCREVGIFPLFFVDDRTWRDSEPNADVDWLHKACGHVMRVDGIRDITGSMLRYSVEQVAMA